MDSSNIDTNSLLQGQDVNGLISQSMQPFATFFMIITVVSVILTIVIFVLWVLSIVRRRKVQSAILDIQATLHEMNEREKSRATPASPAPGTLVDPKPDASETAAA